MADKIDDIKTALEIYINAAAELAESVKRNIKKDGIIDDETILRLNDLAIATNELAELEEISLDDISNSEDNETDPQLN